MTRRPPFVAVLLLVVALVVVGTVGVSSLLQPGLLAGPILGSNGLVDASATATPTPRPRPKPGHEVFGFVPYWEMDAGIAAHLAGTELTTLALFSVTNRKNGTINETGRGYQKITGPIGQGLIKEAHDRGVRVELVYTSFGTAKNAAFFGGKVATQDKVIASLVAFADQIGVDGINVDVELLDGAYVAAYGDFVGRLRAALRAANEHAQVSVATAANPSGAAMAVAAADAGADRIFMMGYDYHWSGSDPGATSPMARLDGSEKSLPWSLDLYESMGVPLEKTLLGLPLYGMSWPVDGGEPDAARTGPGVAWKPKDNVGFLTDPQNAPTFEPVENVEIYREPTGQGSGAASPGASASAGGWEVIYVDSPATLAPKLALADERGLAGAGFWAIGYERGLPAYTALIKRFAEGRIGE